ncbi:hypothetical protein QO017_003618, partial [Methylobacterium gregans]|nr:hypothetical protein [Methylobacterium gregans]
TTVGLSLRGAWTTPSPPGAPPPPPQPTLAPPPPPPAPVADGWEMRRPCEPARIHYADSRPTGRLGFVDRADG